MYKYTTEQLKAIESIKSTAVVAGAGSGKTSVLVDRFVRLVSNNIDTDKILAITFTNKAASEMAERIRNKMSYQALHDKQHGSRFWLEQKRLLSTSYIGTIHGLCANIIRSYPIESGVDPAFYIADENEALMLYSDSIQKTCKSLLELEEPSFLKLCNEYDYSRVYRYLIYLIDKFNIDEVYSPDFAEKLANGHLKALENVYAMKKQFIAVFEELIGGIDDLNKGKHKDNVKYLLENKEKIYDLLEAIPQKEIAADLLDEYIEVLSARSKDKDIVKELKELKNSLVATCYDYKVINLINDWAHIIKVFVENLYKEKQKLSLVTFNDLEYTTYKLLKNNESIRSFYFNRFSQIMVDEFQDTNDLQKRIIYLLASNNEEILSGDKLFVVGDEKQSIYRFRGADVGIFKKVREDIRRISGNEVSLLENFRSENQIINVCNDLFSDLMSINNNSTISYEDLKTTKTENNNVDNVEIIFTEIQDDYRVKEAEAIVGHLFELRKTGEYDFSDMAILLRTKTHLSVYMDAFEKAHIPYNILDSQGFFGVSEINDLLNILRFLENEFDDVALVGMLRSPFFAIDDEILTFYLSTRGANSLWVEINKRLPDSLDAKRKELILRARTIINGFLYDSKMLSLGSLIRIITDKLNVFTQLIAYPDGKQKYANIEKFIDIVFAFEQKTNGGLSEFIDHIDNVLSVGTREGLEEVENESSDSVKILTIHKSKGLEFKVVVIPDCSADFQSNKDSIFYDKSEGIVFNIKKDNGDFVLTYYLNKLKEIEKKQNIEEMKRLFYVAMTRAENRLILSAVKKKSRQDNWYNWLLNSFKEDNENYLFGQNSKIKISDVTNAIFVPKQEEEYKKTNNIDSISSNFNILLKQVEPLEVDQKPDIFFSASSLNDYRHCQKMFFYKHNNMPEIFSHKGISTLEELPANVIGLIVHRAFEYLRGLNIESALTNAIRDFEEYEVSKNLRENIYSWLNTYIKGSLYQDILKEDFLNEVSFLVPFFKFNDQRFFLGGSIDCLVFNKDSSMKIVDFKTDSNLDNKNDEYKNQLMIYKFAAEEMYKNKLVKDLEVHFVKLNQSIVFDTEDISSLDIIKTHCKEIAVKSQENEFNFNNEWCKYCGYTYFCPYAK